MFKEFLIESNLPKLDATLTPRGKKLLAKVLASIAEWSDKDEIPNARFMEVKSRLGSLSDDVGSAISTLVHGGGNEDTKELWNVLGYGTQGIRSFPKKAAKYMDVPAVITAAAIVTEFQTVIDEVTSLKGKAIKLSDKRQAVKKKETEKFDRIIQSDGAFIQAIDEMLKESEDFIKAQISDTIIHGLKKIKIALAEHPDLKIYGLKKYVAEYIYKSPIIMNGLSLVSEESKSPLKLTKESTWIKSIDGLSTKLAKESIAAFKHKMVKKMNGIVAARKVGYKVVYSGGSMGDFDISFDDGASFTMRNKIVINYSPLGKLYNQYPSTFTNVVLQDGSKMKLPSEAKMKNWANGQTTE